MEKNKIIICILVVIIIFLSLCILSMQGHAKEDTKVTIKADSPLYEGDSIKIKLTDLNKTPIGNERINITITDEYGVSSYKHVFTNSKGVAKFKLENVGNYTFNCSYSGNENYTGNSSIKKLTVGEVVEEVTPSQVTYDYSSQSSSSSYSSQSSSEDYRPPVDSDGITRDQADEFGWEYTSEHGGHYIGSNDRWDEEAGVYHD